MSNWITVKEASEQLGVSVRTIQRYITKKQLKSKLVAGKTKIDDIALQTLKGDSKTTANTTVKRQNNDKKHDTTSDNAPDLSQTLMILQDSINTLKEQLKVKDEQINTLLKRQDDILDKLTQIKQLGIPQQPNYGTTQGDTTATEPRQDNDSVVIVDAKTDKNEGDSEATDDTTTTAKVEQVVVTQATVENAPQATTEASSEPDKSKKPEVKTVWQMLGDLFKG